MDALQSGQTHFLGVVFWVMFNVKSIYAKCLWKLLFFDYLEYVSDLSQKIHHQTFSLDDHLPRTMREAFGQVDQTSQGTLTRHEFRTCLTSRMERLSLQEVQARVVGLGVPFVKKSG